MKTCQNLWVYWIKLIIIHSTLPWKDGEVTGKNEAGRDGWEYVLVWFYGCEKHPDLKQLQEVWIYFTVIEGGQGNPQQELEAEPVWYSTQLYLQLRNSHSQGLTAETVEGCCVLVHRVLACLHIQPRIILPERIVLLTVSLALLYQLTTKENPSHTHAHRSIWTNTPRLSSEIILGCVELTRTESFWEQRPGSVLRCKWEVRFTGGFSLFPQMVSPCRV